MIPVIVLAAAIVAAGVIIIYALWRERDDNIDTIARYYEIERDKAGLVHDQGDSE